MPITKMKQATAGCFVAIAEPKNREYGTRKRSEKAKLPDDAKNIEHQMSQCSPPRLRAAGQCGKIGSLGPSRYCLPIPIPSPIEILQA